MGETFEEQVAKFRDELKRLEAKARIFISNLKESEAKEGSDKGEYIAQSILAMRHLEDARMRYGKVLQYLGDGESVYDKK